MSKERTSRIKPFDKYEYLKLKYLERCPFRWSTPEGADWCQRDDHRLFLIALDLYADYLQGKETNNELGSTGLGYGTPIA